MLRIAFGTRWNAERIDEYIASVGDGVELMYTIEQGEWGAI